MVSTKRSSCDDFHRHNTIMKTPSLPFHVGMNRAISNSTVYKCHINVPGQWMNDPTALWKHGDSYFAMFQCGDPRNTWEFGISWGCARSTDMIHWEVINTKFLSPSIVGCDEDGCFTGSIMSSSFDENSYDVFYTGVVRTGYATFDEYLMHASLSHDINASHPSIVKSKQPLLQKNTLVYTDLRDPYVFVSPDGSRCILMGARTLNGDGLVTVHKLSDSKCDSPMQVDQGKPLIQSPFDDVLPECPNIARLEGNLWVLIVSLDHIDVKNRKVLYVLGHMSDDGMSFRPLCDWRPIDSGSANVYATTISTMCKTTHPIIIPWVVDPSGTNNVLGIPRYILLNKESDTLVQQPICMPSIGFDQIVFRDGDLEEVFDKEGSVSTNRLVSKQGKL